MRRCASGAPRPVLTVLALALIGGCGTASTSSRTTSKAPATTRAAALTVTPASGNSSTVFRVRLTGAPSSPAPQGEKVGFELGFRGPTGPHCVGAGSVSLGSSSPAVAALDPARLGGRWCAGSFRVKVEEIASAKCAAGTMCPQFVRVIGVVAEARFTVTG